MKPQFGKLKDAYHQARQGYPENVYKSLQKLLPPDARILDLGCGTGISTRELFRYFPNIIGLDNDREMLRVARKNSSPEIKYLYGSANTVSLKDKSLDVVTVFGAFHWFCDSKSVREIKRVLRPGGLLVVVNKYDRNYVRNDFNKILEPLGKNLSKKLNYNPVKTLEKESFGDVTKRVYPVKEYYSLSEALLLAQSWNPWSYVPVSRQDEYLNKLRLLYQRKLKRGRITRLLGVVVVMGRLRG
jgi:ubiquinone/menaquinone biosynthesis C-methylase UbiE